jgi:Putative porin
MSKKKFNRVSGTVAAAVMLAVAGAAAPVHADEVSELKAAVAALQTRLDQLENKAKVVDETNDRQSDQIAQTRSNVGSWVSNFTWKGDFRYRNETIEQDLVRDRNRDRIRVRTGFVAKVNDTVKVEVGLSTAEGADPRSPNQSLTGENVRKPVYVDLAYAEWQPVADWKFTAGKMKYAWVRPGQSLFFDGDINPEGLAVNYTHGDFFGSAFYNILEERALASETTMGGGQLGWRPTFGSGRLTLGGSFFALNSVKGRNAFYTLPSGPNGNTISTVAANCLGATPCLVNDYDIAEAFAEWTMPVLGRPLALYVDYAQNTAAEVNTITGSKEDTAYSLGFLYGKASDPHTWEIGYFYQSVEKDALFGQYIDSDWGAGNTDASGNVVKFAYAFAKGFTFNGWYHFATTNEAVPVTVPGFGTIYNRDYKRLQLDFNFKF